MVAKHKSDFLGKREIRDVICGNVIERTYAMATGQK